MNSEGMIEAIEPRGFVKELDAPLVMLPSPPPAALQRYRLAAVRLEAQLDARRARRDSRLIVVTSAERGDGKTTTALHLATALSRSLGRRTALVELDRSRPGLASMLSLPPTRGLAEVVEGMASLDEVLLRGVDSGPLIIPGGAADGPIPSSGSMLAPLNALREYHDYVIVDCASLNTSADAAVLGRAADGVVLVVRAWATRGPALAAALEALVDSPLIGTIINDLDGAPGNHAAHVRKPLSPITDEDD